MKPRPFFGFAEYARRRDGRWAPSLNLQRCAVAAALLLAGTYFAGTLLLFLRERGRRGGADVSFAELAFAPARPEIRARLRKARAAALIGEAKRSEDPKSALSLVRGGLSQFPDDPDGRLFFASALFRQRRSRAALEFLRDGLDAAAGHPEYARFFVRQCLAHGEDALLIETAENFLLSEKLSSENRFALAVGAARAEIFRGHFASARARLGSPPLAGTPSGEFLSASVERECGAARAAALRLSRLRERVAAPELDLAIARDFLSLGETENALRFIRASTRAGENRPPSVRVGELALLAEIGTPAASEKSAALTEAFFARLGTDADALRRLAVFAAETRDAALAERCLALARERAFPQLPDFVLLRVETLLRSGNATRAKEILDAVFAEKPGWFAERVPVLNGLRAVAFFACGESDFGRIFLNRALRDARLTAPQTVALARGLADCGNGADALRLLESRLRTEPDSPALLEKILEFSMRLGDAENFGRFTLRLQRSRRPPRAFLVRAAEFARSDRMLFFPQRETLDALFAKMLSGKEDGEP